MERYSIGTVIPNNLMYERENAYLAEVSFSGEMDEAILDRTAEEHGARAVFEYDPLRRLPVERPDSSMGDGRMYLFNNLRRTARFLIRCADENRLFSLTKVSQNEGILKREEPSDFERKLINLAFPETSGEFFT